MASAGVQSTVDTQTAPMVPGGGGMATPATWSYIWFALAILIIIGFHVRIFGSPVPPAAKFP